MSKTVCTSGAVGNVFFGPAPYDGNTKKGSAASMAKRAIIGIIATGAIAAALYFLSITVNNAWNPFNYSADTIRVLAIVSTAGGSVVGLVLTAYFVYKAWAHRPSGKAFQVQ